MAKQQPKWMLYSYSYACKVNCVCKLSAQYLNNMDQPPQTIIKKHRECFVRYPYLEYAMYCLHRYDSVHAGKSCSSVVCEWIFPFLFFVTFFFFAFFSCAVCLQCMSPLCALVPFQTPDSSSPAEQQRIARPFLCLRLPACLTAWLFAYLWNEGLDEHGLKWVYLMFVCHRYISSY